MSLSLDKKIIDNLRKEYPIGTEVELIQMDDPYTKIPIGTKGIVQLVDDTGTIHVKWSCGSSLGVVYGVDKCKKIH